MQGSPKEGVGQRDLAKTVLGDNLIARHSILAKPLGLANTEQRPVCEFQNWGWQDKIQPDSDSDSTQKQEKKV